MYPFASAIDTPLPKPPEEVELMLNYAPKWVDVPSGRGHTHFREYPREGIADWHARRGLTVDSRHSSDGGDGTAAAREGLAVVVGDDDTGSRRGGGCRSGILFPRSAFARWYPVRMA